jgi:hypothetical protein
MVKCLNCTKDAVFSVENPGAAHQTFCAKHLPVFFNANALPYHVKLITKAEEPKPVAPKPAPVKPPVKKEAEPKVEAPVVEEPKVEEPAPVVEAPAEPVEDTKPAE